MTVRLSWVLIAVALAYTGWLANYSVSCYHKGGIPVTQPFRVVCIRATVIQ